MERFEGFDAWFGQSVMRREDGDPMVMYHGTYAANIEVFDRMKSAWRGESIDMVGSWFSDSPGPLGAEMYANGPGAAIYPVYLSIKRPRYFDTFNEMLEAMHEANGGAKDGEPKSKGSPEALREHLKAQGYDGIILARTNVGDLESEYQELMEAVRRAIDEEYSAPREERFIYRAKRERLQESAERLRREVAFFGGSTEFDGQTVAIAFEPEQIKSALGNSGGYSPHNPDIRHSLQQQVASAESAAFATVDSMRAAISEVVGISAQELQRSTGSIVVTTSAERAEQQSEKAFNAWFSGSKAVTDDGKPLTLFHATYSDFDAFTKTRDIGFHFGSLSQAHDIFGRKRNGRTIMPVHVAIKNPLRLLDDPRSWMPQYVINVAIPPGILSEDEKKLLLEQAEVAVENARSESTARRKERGIPDLPDAEWSEVLHSHTAKALAQLRAVLESKGYDGIVYTNRYEGRRSAKEDSWVCFRPEQVKSIFNRGTYELTSADIRHSQKQEIGAEQPAFSAWFGESRVVDECGKPQIVYHGTQADFAIFDGQRQGESVSGRGGDVGFFFIQNPLDAGDHAMADWWRDDPQPNVMPVYLSMQNPEVIDGIGQPSRWYDSYGRKAALDAIAAGRDGLIIGNGENKLYVAFRPEQIKSAIGNRGTYDPRDPDIRHSVAQVSARAQAWHDASTNTTVFLADRIPAGREASVFLHEIVHRHGRAVLPEQRFAHLVDQVKAWGDYDQGSSERAIHDAAQRRVATARVTGAAADEELFAYAVEEAVARGVQPSAAAVKGSAEQWLQAVVQSIQRVGEKLIGNDLQGLDGQDLVDLAYALAQVERPEHAPVIEQALQEALQGAVPAPQQGWDENRDQGAGYAPR